MAASQNPAGSLRRKVAQYMPRISGDTMPDSLLAAARKHPAAQATIRQPSELALAALWGSAAWCLIAIAREPSEKVTTRRSSRNVGSHTASVTTGCTAKRIAASMQERPPFPTMPCITIHTSTVLIACKTTLVKW